MSASPMVELGIFFGRTLVGLMLILAGVLKVKAGSPWFLKTLLAYDLVHRKMTAFLSKGLPWLEVVCGFLLVFGFFTPFAALTGFVILLIFTSAVTSAILRDRPVDCGCFGRSTKVSRARWTLVYRNIVLMGLLLPVYAFGGGSLSVECGLLTKKVSTVQLFCVFVAGILLLIGCASPSTRATTTSTPRHPSLNLISTPTPKVNKITERPTSIHTPTVISAAAPRTQHGDSFAPSVSADGRYVAFSSSADDLVPSDTNSKPDIFVYDRMTGVMERVSVSSRGEESNGFSWSGSFSISADGRWITFSSEATNLAPDDANRWNPDVFVHDRLTGETERISVSSEGVQGNAASSEPAISADGRYVVFSSLASNLVPGESPDTWDVFVHDRQTGTTERVSTAIDGRAAGQSDAPVISADGRYVAFWSFATNLVADDTERCLREDGSTYNCGDVFVYDRQTGAMERIVANEPSGLGRCGYELGISTDGRYVGFYSVIYDRQTRETEPGGTAPRFSADGRYVAYVAEGIILRDRQTGESRRVSVAADGTPSNGRDGYATHHEGCSSGQLSISADGRWIAFTSSASNLVPDSTEECYDYFRPEPRNCYNIFVHDRLTGQTERVSVPGTK